MHNFLIVLEAVLQKYFYLSQIVLGALFLLGGWLLLRPGSSKTFFKDRNQDSQSSSRYRSGRKSDPLAEARLQMQTPLSLPGIRIDGAPHEILGVSPGAGKAEIQKAYRELMRRYHPDQVARPGTQAWHDAQKIAEAINHAKDVMLSSLRS